MKPKTTDFSRLATSTPIDEAAARVVSQRGVGDIVPRVPSSTIHSDVPLTTKTVPLGLPDYTGRKFGKLTVTGYHGAPGNWAVRCVCGIYEVRKTKTIVAARNDAECQRCNKVRQLARCAKRQAYFDRFGRWPDHIEKFE